jgi:protein arginine kinase
MADKKFYLLENETSRDKHKNINKNKIILNTKVKLARNIAGMKFASISGSQGKNALLREIRKYIGDCRGFKNFRFYDIKSIKGLQRNLLIKDYILDPEILRKVSGKGIFLKNSRTRSVSSAVIINHEDHITIQSIYPALQIYKAYKEVTRIERYFEKGLTFAFDKNLGYLTASPSDIGTALRVTVVAHLPVLAVSSEFADLLKRIGKIGYRVNGYFVKQSEIVGNLFKVFNQVTLGKEEKEMLEEMQAICLSIIEEEQKARKQLKKNDLLGIGDNIYRSFGLLKYAKMLSYEEALELLSIIRLGLDMDLIDGVNDFNFFELAGKISNSRIIVDMEISDKPGDDRIDMIRADMIREKILKEVD